MRTSEMMAAVTLTTAVVLVCNTAVLGYAYATLHARQAYSYQWPAVAETRHHILLGLLLQAIGWSVHQSYWWVWQQAAATRATGLVSTIESWSVVVMPAHVLMVLGAGLVSAPAARSLFGCRWHHILTVLIAACAVVGYYLAAGGAK